MATKKTSKTPAKRTTKAEATVKQALDANLLARRAARRVILAEDRLAVSDVADKEFLPKLLTHIKETGITSEQPEEGLRQQPHSGIMRWAYSEKGGIIHRVMKGLGYQKFATIVELTKQEIEAMPKENEEKKPAAKSAAEVAAEKKKKAEATWIETPRGRIKRGSLSERIWELLNHKSGHTHAEILADVTEKGLVPNDPETTGRTINMQIAKWRKVCHVGRDAAGRYSVHIEERERSRVLTPEQKAEKAAKAKEAEAAKKAKADEKKKKEAEKKAAEKEAAEKKKEAEAAKKAAAKGVKVNVPGATVVSAGK